VNSLERPQCFAKVRLPPERYAYLLGESKTECRVVELGYTIFAELNKEDAGMLYDLASQLTDFLGKTAHKVGALRLLDVTNRVARTLLDLCKKPMP